LLAVDNEEADRELLVQLLQPLGFEVRTAASGFDALDLMATGYLPQVMLIDLAMPGIDGWETLRRMRALMGQRFQDMAVAIVSANAFDKGLDNDLNIPVEDFVLKPVRHSELLDWLERRLALTWVDEPLEVANHSAPAVAPASPGFAAYPDRFELQALMEVVNLGYYRGIMNKLDAMQGAHPAHEPFISALRSLAQRFSFEQMAQVLRAQLNPP
jgi:CheY-like chemotaxis protein